MPRMTGSELFALALGKVCRGPHACFWCGAPCDESHAHRSSDTFWDWDQVAHPASRYDCAGCAEALDERRVMRGRDKPQKTRNYTWLATSADATPYTKADITAIRAACLCPPPAPWMLAIAASGQKHVIYRTPVNESSAPPHAVQLEQATVLYTPTALREALALCDKIAAGIGKPVLSGALDLSMAMRYAEHHGHGSLGDVDRWNATWNRPVSRLAAFLSLKKEEAQREYPQHADAGRGRIPPKAGRSRGRAGERRVLS